MSNIKVGRYFYLEEFTASPTATRLGITLCPDTNEKDAIKDLCDKVLDPIREYFGEPVIVTSGFRTLELNKAIGGSRRSQHMWGEAADIKIGGLSSLEIARAVKDLKLDFDQCIVYAPERGGHAHISFTRRRDNRRQFLYAPAEGGYTPLEEP